MCFEAVCGFKRQKLVPCMTLSQNVREPDAEPSDACSRKLLCVVSQCARTEAIRRKNVEAVRVTVDQSENRDPIERATVRRDIFETSRN